MEGNYITTTNMAYDYTFLGHASLGVGFDNIFYQHL